jgi:hypothetical protein
MESSTVTQTTSSRSTSAFNPRLLVLILVIAAPLGWMAYTFVKLSVTGGIEQVGDYKQVDLKSMGNFTFDDRKGTVKDVPEQYRALDGQKVLLVGQMYADLSADDMVNSFQLVYSIQKCCFGGPPKVQERVFAQAPGGKKVPVYSALAKVYGILHVRTKIEGGKVVSLYDMDVEKVVGSE